MSQEVRSLMTFLLPTIGLVALILFGVQLWLQGGGVGGEQGRAEPADEPGGMRTDSSAEGSEAAKPAASEEPGASPIGFAPVPGNYLMEVRSEGEVPRNVGMEFRLLADGSTRVIRPYFPPISLLAPVPEQLKPHLGRIRMHIDISPEGGVLDVTGPDAYFDRLDAENEGSADAIRDLQLEEQMASAMTWPMESILAGPAVGKRRWEETFTLAGFGEGQARRIELRFETKKPDKCGPKEMEELCLEVILTTLTSSDGSSIDGSLWIGVDTGMNWVRELVVRGKGEPRVLRTVLRPY